MFPGEREIRRVVVERGGLPCRCRVALHAICREIARDMVRVRRRGEIRLVAAETLRRRPFEFSIDVAIGAGGRKVRAGEGKRRKGMIKTAVPRIRRDGVARNAICGKSGRRMVRICRPCVIGAVTAHAFNRRSTILIVRRIGMARLARQDTVPSEESKPGLFMLLDHVRDLPRLHRMTAQAVFAKLALMHVRVARSAGRAGRGEFQVRVAGRTGD
jgi:hypothetical protein